ncbi:globin-like protein [Globomyces pollinis-pini]|nr:globin-like protein [Globomyces pollinis-pini]
MSSEKTLYEKLGGEPAIDATVELFYDMLLKDELVAPIFAKTNMKRQRRMQKSFLIHVLGGTPYDGKNMRVAHAKLNLTEEHFNRVAVTLAKAMTTLGVSQDLVDEVIAIAATTKDDVLGREPKKPFSLNEHLPYVLAGVAVGGAILYRYYSK